MHVIPNLNKTRKLIVGNALGDALAAPRSVPLAAATQTRAEAVLAATEGLRMYARHRPIEVDRATDAAVMGNDHTLAAKERALCDAAVPLGDAQRDELARVRRLRGHLFPAGTGFIQRSMDLQWGELVDLRARAEEPQAAADIDALGMRSQMDHLLAHIELYGRILGQNAHKARAGEEKASAAWSEAFQLFLAQVLVDYAGDATIQQELLGPYEAQLAQQRAAMRAAARARKARAAAEAEDAGPRSSEGGAAPPA